MQTMRLNGHSGCSVILFEENGRPLFVRKVSASREYNARLIRQAEKQESFYSKVLRAPKVLQKGYGADGLFYFDMEYIHGITLSEYIKTMEVSKIRDVVDAILSDLFIRVFDGKPSINAKGLFSEKINLLKATDFATEYPWYRGAIEILDSHDWSFFAENECHGDLTFENIIIKDGELWLIDFLDSFYESALLDVATLLQDSLAMWSYREQKPDINTIIRLAIFRDSVIEKAREKLSDNYVELYFALLLKLVRIVPYTKDKMTISFLQGRIEVVIGIIGRLGDL